MCFHKLVLSEYLLFSIVDNSTCDFKCVSALNFQNDRNTVAQY